MLSLTLFFCIFLSSLVNSELLCYFQGLGDRIAYGTEEFVLEPIIFPESTPKEGLTFYWDILTIPRRGRIVPSELFQLTRESKRVRIQAKDLCPGTYWFSVSVQNSDGEKTTCFHSVDIEDKVPNINIISANWFSTRLEGSIKKSPCTAYYEKSSEIILLSSMPLLLEYYWTQTVGPRLEDVCGEKGLIQNPESMHVAIFLPPETGFYEFQLIGRNSIGNSTPHRITFYLPELIQPGYACTPITYTLNLTWPWNYITTYLSQ